MLRYLTVHGKAPAASAADPPPMFLETNVPGMVLLANALTREQEAQALAAIDAHAWDSALSRQTQQYGYVYPYFRGSGSSERLEETEAMPDWAHSMLRDVIAAEATAQTTVGDSPSAAAVWSIARTVSTFPAVQAIVNRYEPGQGIAPHVDDVGMFGPYVLAVSLGSDIVMTFSRPSIEGFEAESHHVHIPRRSAYLLTGDSRYLWRHGIDKVKSDAPVGGDMRLARAYGLSTARIPRGVRTSVTFRSLRKSLMP